MRYNIIKTVIEKKTKDLATIPKTLKKIEFADKKKKKKNADKIKKIEQIYCQNTDRLSPPI